MYIVWNNIVSYVDSFFGIWFVNSELILIMLFVLILIIIFNKLLNNSLFKNRKQIIYQYDNVFYLISWYNYQTGTDDGIDIMHNLFDIKNPSYLYSHKTIFEAVQKIENDFWKKIIPIENRSKITKLRKKIRFWWFFVKFLKFILILAVILFVASMIYANY